MNKPHRKSIYLVIVLVILGSNVFCQTFNLDSLDEKITKVGNFILYGNHDTNYIKNLSDKLAIKLIANDKVNFFRVRDRDLDNNVFYRPQRGLNLGVGVAFKWFAFDITFNSGVEEKVDDAHKKYIDFQGRIFSSKHLLEGSVQYYYGYKLGRVNGTFFESDDTSSFRNDIRTIGFGLQYLHVLNYRHFSLQAPFVMNEIQRKSAGSVILGLGYDMFSVDGDSSTIPPSMHDMFNPTLHYTDLNVINLSLKVGYMYNLVPKEHFYFSLGFIPGINLNFGDLYLDTRTPIKTHLALNFKLVTALGYNGERVFVGLQLIGDTYSVRMNKDSGTMIGRGKLMFYLGYRFKGKRVKNRRKAL